MLSRRALLVVLLAGCGGSATTEPVARHDASPAASASRDAPAHYEVDATVHDDGRPDAHHAPFSGATPTTDAARDAAAACDFVPPSAGCPGGPSGWPDAAALCDEAGVRIDCGRTGQPCCGGYCQGMQYCDLNNQCSPNCGHQGESCCLISLGGCPACEGSLMCFTQATQPEGIRATVCEPGSVCRADDAGNCTTCGASGKPCCADAGCSFHQAEYCAVDTCYESPPMR